MDSIQFYSSDESTSYTESTNDSKESDSQAMETDQSNVSDYQSSFESCKANELPTCSKYCDQQNFKSSSINKSTGVNSSERKDYFNLDGDSSDDELTESQLNSEIFLNDVVFGPLKNKDYSFTHPIPKDYFTSLANQTIPDSKDIVKNFRPEPVEGAEFNTKRLQHLGKDFMFRHCVKAEKSTNYIPRKICESHVGHKSMITSLEWCIPQYSHLFLSASTDGSIRIWDMFHLKHIYQIRKQGGIKAAKWTVDGKQVLFGGYRKTAHVQDIQSGKAIRWFDLQCELSSLSIHPYSDSLFLCGIRNAVLAFDLRSDSKQPVKRFYSKCEEVLDIAFLDKDEFAVTTNFVSRDSADRTIMVWDFPAGAVTSKQIYLERYTCPSLKVNSITSSFVAQTNGDYIVAFSSKTPYKMRDRRYMGHKVSGYGIEVDISPDGYTLVSGDANGYLHFYDYFDAKLLKKIAVKPGVVTNKVKWHPVFQTAMIAATWDGEVHLFQ